MNVRIVGPVIEVTISDRNLDTLIAMREHREEIVPMLVRHTEGGNDLIVRLELDELHYNGRAAGMGPEHIHARFETVSNGHGG